MKRKAPIKSHKEGENTISCYLVELLHKNGFPSASFEPIYPIYIKGRKTISKPDIHFQNGGTHIISAKKGDTRAELQAWSTALEYSNNLRDTINLGMVFGVCYPSSDSGKFRAYVIPIRPGERFITATFDTLSNLADFITDTVNGLKEKYVKIFEPPQEGATRLLRASAETLSDSIRNIPIEQLEIVFGGVDFFDSVLQSKIKGSSKMKETLRMGVSFLYINQIVFYILLSRSAEKAGRPDEYPVIQAEDFPSPESINDKYFSLVRKKDYKPIYGFNVAQFFDGKDASEANIQVIRSILGLAPTLELPDITGQIFQTLIPYEIRKPLGAHYTNPKAARLLTEIAIPFPEATVFDPACGSGTLLVAAYKRKMEMTKDIDKEKKHKIFVEKEITGIDAMAFSSHLAAVNLALQQPLLETNSVRIATEDSTIQRPGHTICRLRNVLQQEFIQPTLEFDFSKPKEKTLKKRGPVSLVDNDVDILLEKVDTVIMNPPFTSWDNMSDEYRKGLTRIFSNINQQYRKIIYGKISQQAFFILLADLFLKEKGTIAAVLPLTTFTGGAFKFLVPYLLNNYTIKYIFIGLGRSSYSEDTSLTECLFVAIKKKPRNDHKISIIGTKNDPNNWTNQEIRSIHHTAISGKSNEKNSVVKKFLQKDMSQDNKSLSSLVLRLWDEYSDAMNIIEKVESNNNLTTILAQLKSRNMDINRWVLGSEHLSFYGAKALLICKSEDRALKNVDRLIFDNKIGNKYVIFDKIGKSTFQVGKDTVKPALRRFSYIDSIDITNKTDYCISNPSEEMARILIAFYGKEDAIKYMKRIKEVNIRFPGGRWSSRVNEGSSNLFIARRLDLSAPGTIIISCWNENQTFLSGDGFFLKYPKNKRNDFKNIRFSKLLCLWLNSSYAIAKLMGKMTITRGSWMKFEKSSIINLPIIDMEQISDNQWEDIEQVHSLISKEKWPSLLDQLKRPCKCRDTLDDLILKILKVDKHNRKKYSKTIKAGLYNAIINLQKSMR